MTEKYTKYKKVINTPQESMGDIFTKIKNWKPDNNWKQLVRVPGATTAFSLYLLLWLITKIVAENPIIEKLTDNNANKKINSSSDNFFKRAINMIKKQKKKSPNASAFIVYYMAFTMLIFGGKITYEHADDIQKYAKELKKNIGHFDNEIESLKLDPNADEDTWQQQVEAVHPYVIAHIFSSEGIILDEYDDNGGNGTATVGAGFTVQDDVHKAFAERILQRPVSVSNFHVTKSEARFLSDAWLREKVYPKIKQQFKVPMDYKLFVILAVAAYNKGDNIYNDGNSGQIVRNTVNNKRAQKDILHAYIRAFGGKEKTKWSGLANKYALCGMYYAGNVKDATVLKAIAEAPYTLDKPVRRYQKGAVIKGSVPGRLLTYDSDGRVNGLIVPENIDSMLLETKTRITQGTLQEPVMNYLSEDEVYRIMHGHMFEIQSNPVVHLKSDDNIDNDKVEKDEDFDVVYNKAIALYKQQKYQEAVTAFEQLLILYPNNALLYNDLALMYNKTGQYDKAIKHSQIVVRQIGDKSQYGAAQYNAGYAYEQLGNLQKALQNYNLALSNGNNAAREAIKRVKKNMQNQKSKSIAFNDGIVKIKEKQNKSNNNQIYNFNNENMV